MPLLTPLQRRVWLLWRDGKLGTTDIARVLGTKPQVADTILRRVREKLERAAREGEEARRLLRGPRPARPTTEWVSGFSWPRQ